MTAKHGAKHPVGQVQMRVSVDAHMGPIYEHLAAIPSALRSRELIALARAGMLLTGAPALSVSAGTTTTGGRPGTSSDAGDAAPAVRVADPTAGLDHLLSIADSTPPLH